MDIIADFNGAKIRKTIHLIRHGQTDFNKQGIIQGSGIDSDLNETGRWQALRFFESYQSHPYDHIYTSKLRRTIQSVEPFIQKGIQHTPLDEFNEINWGIMEGRKSSPETAHLYDSIVKKWSSGAIDTAIEKGETPLEMYNRQAKGMQYLMSKTHEEQVLICMHGRAIRSFLCLLTGVPLMEMEKWHHNNLCLYELEYRGPYFEIVKANDQSHLL
ncbi:MAG: histidine phosphatase family protein [Bacteroidetes bacterium]|nr:histidine phosphatase family protein [Bacteroidota bacterium]